ncbi:putative metal-binding motif-containing protein [Lacinutrix himadriensis]|uniref:putative metal-binding motif-containing protein n=1 Tax=Lacinutrix himadriensis TaxID=641549 RepID=UPI0009FAFD63|nr:putative metal-binding motif-containing protein [Lacinutrix himadriensis]
MKKRFFKTILPVMLLVSAVFIIGAGCGDGISDPPQDFQNYWPDIDQDGYGDASVSSTSYTADDVPVNYIMDNTDCNDNDATAYPGATEILDNGIDEDCDGYISITLFVDADGDGFGNPNATEVVELLVGESIPSGYSYYAGDCGDSDANINPLADEVLGNGIDDNCDGNSDILEYYTDADGDGYGAGAALPPPASGVNNNIDCDDSNAAIHPYNIEVLDGIDNDCDGVIDEN